MQQVPLQPTHNPTPHNNSKHYHLSNTHYMQQVPLQPTHNPTLYNNSKHYHLSNTHYMQQVPLQPTHNPTPYNNSKHYHLSNTHYTSYQYRLYLPQFHLYGRIQLHEPCIKIELLCLGLVDAHVGSLRRQLADVLQVFAQLVTQLSELCLAVVFQAEGERLQHTQQFHGTPAEVNSCHCGTPTDLFKISHHLPNSIFYFFSKFQSCAKK